MTTASALLDIQELAIHTAAGLPLVNKVSFQVNRREIVALVGGSGSGKTLSSLSLLGLLPPGGANDLDRRFPRH